MDEFSDDLEQQAVGRGIPRRTTSTGSAASRTTSFIGVGIDYLLNEDTSSSSDDAQQFLSSSRMGSSRYSGAGSVRNNLENSPAEGMGGGNLINMSDVNLDGSGYQDRTRGGMDHSAHSNYSYDNNSSKSGRRLLCFTLLFVACIGLAAGVAGLRDHGSVAPAPQKQQEPPKETVGVSSPEFGDEKEDAEPPKEEEEKETADNRPIPENERIDPDTIEEIEEGLKEQEGLVREQQEHALDEENEIPSEDLETEDILDDELGALAHEMGAIREEEKAWEEVGQSETVNEQDLYVQETEVLDKQEDNLQDQASLLEEEANAGTAKEREELAGQVEELQEEEKNLEQRQADLKDQEGQLQQREVGDTGAR